MASPGNRQCASCIGAVSFAAWSRDDESEVCWFIPRASDHLWRHEGRTAAGAVQFGTGDRRQTKVIQLDHRPAVSHLVHLRTPTHTPVLRYDTIRDAILTCARKPT